MWLHAAAAATVTADRLLHRPACPRCNAEQLAPERSALVGDGQVRHTWSCEECGAAFTTFAAFGAFRG